MGSVESGLDRCGFGVVCLLKYVGTGDRREELSGRLGMRRDR